MRSKCHAIPSAEGKAWSTSVELLWRYTHNSGGNRHKAANLER